MADENSEVFQEWKIDNEGVVRLDGIPIGRRRVIRGRVILEIRDRFNERVVTMKRRYIRGDVEKLYRLLNDVNLED